MPAKAITDAYGTTYHIPEDKAVKTPGSKWRPGLPALEVWWSRDGAKADETIIIRQEYEGRATAEVLELTQGQAYDLLDALNKALESK